CVFAWEFDTMPLEAWDNDPRHNWQYVFSQITGVISTSEETAKQIKALMGDSYPCCAIPSATWNKYSSVFAAGGWEPLTSDRHIPFTGTVIDSQAIAFSAEGLAHQPPQLEAEPDLPTPTKPTFFEFIKQSLAIRKAYKEEILALDQDQPKETTQEIAEENKETATFHNLMITGVVYTTLLNPADNRKHWCEIVTAFCWAFKDKSDATLIVKMTHHDPGFYQTVLMTMLSRLSPFKCRVLILHSFLNHDEYKTLIANSTFYVNASSCEGLCLPLLEFLSAGKPAIAPDHTAMKDYMNSDIGFVLKYCNELACWPHDPSGMLTTHRTRLNWESLMRAFAASYQLAKETPERYKNMSLTSSNQLHSFCSIEFVSKKLSEFLCTEKPTAACNEAAS
ncbi:MAG: glycosyltransferase family 1 protein, partial [Pseudomonadales bacterium]|nr:glycosyltransferase family 1 protein [Pseudomonadales bacterium]